ncbi:MAG: PAS domain-containing protein, partial [Mariprofundales bacterium]
TQNYDSNSQSTVSTRPLYTNYPAARMQDSDRIIERLLQKITGDYVTLALAVDEHLELQYVAGDTEGFFKIPSGKVQNNVAKMSVKELSIPLSTGIQRAINKDEEVIYANISIYRDKVMILYDMKVKPLENKKSQLPLIGIFLQESRTLPNISITADGDNTYDVSKEAKQRIIDLEQSLQFHKENLQATVEELETSNEELQATNEELMASNEELQSTNEELQSVNEELYTVNAEYQNKILELTEANNDLENLNASTQIATLFLDENMSVRKYTPMLTRIYKVIDSDIGRPFSHLSHYLLDINPLALAEKVIDRDTKFECEVNTEHGDSYLMRIQPYHIAPNVYSGIVITFIDVNAYHAEHTMLQSVMNAMLDAVVIIDDNGIIQQSNPAIEKILGYQCRDLIGKNINMIMPSGQERQQHTSFIKNYLRTGEAKIIGIGRKVKALCHDGSMKEIHLSITKVSEGDRTFFTACMREL